ncbi:MAG: DUF501 domain-containing protein [Luminiphilus sp.]|nr:DUF501 domain-containing protein [Luminiphilus sp.]
MSEKNKLDAVSESKLERWRPYIRQCLDREPRGLRSIVAWDDQGRPRVIQVALVVDGKPFPTVFWLIDPALCLAIDRLEAAGCIASLQQRVNDSAELRAEMRIDHEKHQAVRAATMTLTEREFLESSGMIEAFTTRGIGGIQGVDRIRCLHTWYAAHCVQSNVVGNMVDELLYEGPSTLISDAQS